MLFTVNMYSNTRRQTGLAVSPNARPRLMEQRKAREGCGGWGVQVQRRIILLVDMGWVWPA